MVKEIYFAGGCFWGTEKYFSLIDGVLETQVGYANGRTENPTYEEVCAQSTGHAETVRVVYEADVLTLPALLDLFYEVIDPTALNRQGNDVGTQYRTGVYYTDEKDAPVVHASLRGLQAKLQRRVAVEAERLQNFYPAEEYHQKYLDKNPGGYCHIGPAAFKKAKAPQAYRKKTQEQMKEELSPLQYEVTQHSATEPPFQNEFFGEFRPGIYVDITSGQPLFVSTNKFESGCGWPSFSKPIEDGLLYELNDNTLSRPRTEVRSKLGDAHLGHVFEDGPPEQGGLRYCINSAALRFIPKQDMEKEGYADYLPMVKE